MAWRLFDKSGGHSYRQEMEKNLIFTTSVLWSLLSSVALAGADSGHASQNIIHDATPAEIQAADAANARYHEVLLVGAPTGAPPQVLRPVEDTADFAYVLMNADEEGSDEVGALRSTIAQNLPEGVKLVILGDTGQTQAIQSEYAQWISPDRLIVATDDSTESGFWARDSFPVPVWDSNHHASLVAAKYYRDFQSWDAVATSVSAPIQKVGFTFVGGNLLADEEGNCFSVDSYRLFTVTPADLAQAYGCKTVHLMPHVRGLGDVDEVLKPLPGKRILTNSPEYVAALQSWGYQVILLPTRSETYRTYVNSLIVRGTVFMPSYGDSQDGDAQKVYESLGFKVIPIQTISLSDDMHGSIHCQTMAYPAMDQAVLLKALHARY